MQRTVTLTPDHWDLDQGVTVAATEDGQWRVCLWALPDEITPDDAEAVAACLFQAAADARAFQQAGA